MHDRARLVSAAIAVLREREDVDTDRIGVIGFSQAGWVLPLLPGIGDSPRAMIIVSGAVNWKEQGEYHTQNRLERSGYTRDQIQEILRYMDSCDAFLETDSPYEAYRSCRRDRVPSFYRRRKETMSPERFRFVGKNMRSDIRDSLHSIRCPFLGVYGGKDLHVNPVESPEVYRRRFQRSKHPDYTIRVFPNANHSLLREEIFGTSGEMGFWELLKLYWMEEMAPGSP